MTGVVVVLVVLSGCSGLGGSPASDPGADGQPSTAEPTAAQTAIDSTNGTLEIHFINVGQSVSTLIVGPTNETMLIDSGDFRDDGEYVLQYLERKGIDRLDHFVVSHADADHIGGNAAIINHYETEANGIGAIYDPGIAASTQTYEEYLDAVEAHDVTLYQTREGDRIDFDGVDIDVLGPPDPYLEDRARNENSIVLKLSFGQTSFLFTGDAEDDQEQYLVDTYGQELEATILKAGHHGSSSSTRESLLDAAAPKAIVISSAYDSQYDHPHEEVLQRLSDRSIPTYWTATHGDIVLVSDGKQVSVKTQQEAPTDPRSLREGAVVEPGTTAPVVLRETFVGGQETPVLTDGGTPTDSGGLVVDEIHADAGGDDRENLGNEYVIFRNTGERALDLSGWTVADESGKTYEFPDGFSLEPGEMVTLYTGSGTDGRSALYWGFRSPVWNNGGDTVLVTNDEGQQVLSEEYA